MNIKFNGMKKENRIKFVIVSILLIIFTSCSSDVTQVKEKDQIKELNQFFEQVSQRREKIKTIFLEAKADIFQRGNRVRGRLMMSTKRPGMARVDTISPFELPISTLIIKDNELSFYNLKYNKHYHGPASERNISRFLPIRLNMEQFIDMLSGISPMIKFKEHTLKYNKKDATYDIVLIGDGQKQYIKYIAATLQIKKMTIYKKGKKRFYIEFSDFREKDGIKYARKILFEDFVKKSKAKLKITEIDFNKSQDDSVYEEMKGNFRDFKLN